MRDLTIIVPTLNEEENVERIVTQIRKVSKSIKIIVADDGSKDKTVQVARKNKVIVVDRKNAKVKGITAAVCDAARYVKTKYFIVMDADLQHPPSKVADIYKKLKSNDIVVGVRRKVIGKWGWFRKLESRVATLIAKARLGRDIKDPMSGFFGINKAYFDKVKKSNFELKCFKILFNILKNSKDAKVATVKYDFDIRKRGESKIRAKHVAYFLHNFVK